ncbi:uncharacterized protein [Periplaneta americana]|uniref:uncharacterized protein n=1 Tax=Periplaneta americana TaxID=6978 RepID=UPI0037E99454
MDPTFPFVTILREDDGGAPGPTNGLPKGCPCTIVRRNNVVPIWSILENPSCLGSVRARPAERKARGGEARALVGAEAQREAKGKEGYGTARRREQVKCLEIDCGPQRLCDAEHSRQWSSIKVRAAFGGVSQSAARELVGLQVLDQGEPEFDV